MCKIKICGIRRQEDIEIVNRYEPEYIGFVLAPSKRQISLEQAASLKALLKPSIKALGVFVNEEIDKIKAYSEQGIIDMIQLHGDEDAAYTRSLKQSINLPIIKAQRIQSQQDIDNANHIETDYVLLDKYSDKAYGGLGEQFDWRLLVGMTRHYFLAGGIGIHNVMDALAYRPYCMDISSKVETNGYKDETKIRELVEKVRKDNG